MGNQKQTEEEIMEGNLMLCKSCKKIIGCEKPIAGSLGVIQKLCYQTCIEPPEECERRELWFKKRIADLCPRCWWEAEKCED